MRLDPRADDFEQRRRHLSTLSDEALEARFWELVQRLVDPLIDEARTHTTPSIERSVLLRMGLASDQAKAIVARGEELGLLGHGMGHLVLELSKTKGLGVRETAEALCAGHHWEVLVNEAQRR